MDKKIKKIAVRVMAVLMAVFAVISMLSPYIEVNAADDDEVTHARVVLAPLNNTNTDTVDVEVVEEDQDGWRVINQWDNDGGTNYGTFTSDYCGKSSSGEPSTSKKSAKDEIDTDKKNGSSNGGCVYLSFPGQQYKNEHGIRSTDVALASNVSSIMTDSFEKLTELINKSVNSSSSDEFSISNITEKMMELTEGEDGTGKGSFSIKGYKITFTPLSQASSSKYSEAKSLNKYKVTEGYSKGTTADNYCVVSVSKGNEEINYEVIQFSVPKGYSTGQYDPKGYDSSNDDAPTPVKYISMKGMAYYAAKMENYGHVSGTSSYKLMYGDDDNAITSIIKTLFNSIFNSVYKMLGCEDVVSIIFNRGARSVSYYEGVAPYKYFDVAQIFFWISMVVACFIMFYSVYLVVIKHSLADISPSTRVDVKDSIKNLILVIILEIMFVPIFSLMCRLNGLVVSMFSSLIGSSVSLTDMGGGSIGVILFSFLTFGMTIALNVRYVVRSIVCAVCYGVAPAAIASISVDTKHTLFNTWLKEMIANIFLQSFNAIILAFLLMITTSSKGIMRYIILYSFIPLNKWFMEDLMGAKTGASVASDNAMRGLTTAKDRAFEAVNGAAQVAIGSGITEKPQLTAPKKNGGFGSAAGGDTGGLSDLKGYVQTTGNKKLLGNTNTDATKADTTKQALKGTPGGTGSTIKGKLNSAGTALTNGARKAATATKDYVQGENFSKLATGLTALGVAGANLAGAKINPNTAKMLGSVAGTGYRRKQNELANGFSGVRSGFAHVNENGQVDGVAFSNQDKIDFENANGVSGTWQKADFHKVDKNQIGTDSMNAIKGNEAQYFSGDAGTFRPTVQTDDKGNDYVLSSAGVVPDMHQKQAAAQKSISGRKSASSMFGLGGEAFATVSSPATRDEGYDSVTNAMEVRMPDYTTRYALDQKSLEGYQKEGGQVVGMVQASQISPSRVTPEEMAQFIGDDSVRSRMGAKAIVDIGGKATVISDIGENLPSAAGQIANVQSDIKDLAEKGYQGSKQSLYAIYDENDNVVPRWNVNDGFFDVMECSNGQCAFATYDTVPESKAMGYNPFKEEEIDMVNEESGLPYDQRSVSGYGKRNPDGLVTQAMTKDMWNALTPEEQAEKRADGWKNESFISRPKYFFTKNEIDFVNENPKLFGLEEYNRGAVIDPRFDVEPVTVFTLSDTYKPESRPIVELDGEDPVYQGTVRTDSEYGEIAKKQFNVEHVQANARYVDGINGGVGKIVLRGTPNASPPNVDGIVGNERKKRREAAKKRAKKDSH